MAVNLNCSEFPLLNAGLWAFKIELRLFQVLRFLKVSDEILNICVVY